MANKFDKSESDGVPEEYPDNWWYKVYVTVLVVTVLVIAGLWAFSKYFS